jgi:hypothetical protein
MYSFFSFDILRRRSNDQKLISKTCAFDLLTFSSSSTHGNHCELPTCNPPKIGLETRSPLLPNRRNSAFVARTDCFKTSGTFAKLAANGFAMFIEESLEETVRMKENHSCRTRPFGSAHHVSEIVLCHFACFQCSPGHVRLALCAWDSICSTICIGSCEYTVYLLYKHDHFECTALELPSVIRDAQICCFDHVNSRRAGQSSEIIRHQCRVSSALAQDFTKNENVGSKKAGCLYCTHTWYNS